MRNLTSDGTKTYYWNALNQLSEIDAELKGVTGRIVSMIGDLSK